MGNESHRRALTERLEDLARNAGLDPMQDMPRKVRPIVLTMGPTVLGHWLALGNEGESLRWLAVALRYWSERCMARAEEYDARVREAVDTLSVDRLRDLPPGPAEPAP